MPRPKLLTPKAAQPLFDGRTQGWPDAEWYGFWKELEKRAPRCGSVTFATATTAAVTLSPPEISTDYMVVVEAPEDRRVWITSKATTGFTINVSANSAATYNWALIRQ